MDYDQGCGYQRKEYCSVRVCDGELAHFSYDRYSVQEVCYIAERD